MTEFERIKAMDVVDLAIYIADLQMEAVNNYHFNHRFPKGYFDNIDMLEGEAKVSDVSVEDKLVSATERSAVTRQSAAGKDEFVKE